MAISLGATGVKEWSIVNRTDGRVMEGGCDGGGDGAGSGGGVGGR